MKPSHPILVAVLSILLTTTAVQAADHDLASAPPWGLIVTPVETGVHLEWNAPVTDGSPDPVLYRVYRLEDTFTATLIAETTNLTHLDEEAGADPVHAYAVTSVTQGHESVPAFGANSSYPYCHGVSVLPPDVGTGCYYPPPSPIWPPPDFPGSVDCKTPIPHTVCNRIGIRF